MTEPNDEDLVFLYVLGAGPQDIIFKVIKPPLSRNYDFRIPLYELRRLQKIFPGIIMRTEKYGDIKTFLKQIEEPTHMVIRFYSEDELVVEEIYPIDIPADQFLKFEDEINEIYPDAEMHFELVAIPSSI